MTNSILEETLIFYQNELSAMGLCPLEPPKTKNNKNKSTENQKEALINQSFLEFKNIHFHYKDKIILNGINLTVKKGEKILIKGKSGCGKSTLFQLVLGFKRPTQGKIFFENKEITPSTIWDIRKKISYVDQDISLPDQNVMEFFNFVSSFKTNKNFFKLEKLKSYMNLFCLHENVLSKSIGDLSGGERQRLMLIVALLLKRNIFLLDEPTSSLDKNLKQIVVDNFLKNKNFTVLVISHDGEWEIHPCVKIFNLESGAWEQ